MELVTNKLNKHIFSTLSCWHCDVGSLRKNFSTWVFFFPFLRVNISPLELDRDSTQLVNIPLFLIIQQSKLYRPTADVPLLIY